MSPAIQLDGLQTESINPNSKEIDQVTTRQLCQIINNEDASVALTVERCIPAIAEAIETLEKRGRQGGRVIYVGAGTSGRLGVLDASEIPPTYSASSKQFVALIAGGDAALRYAQEGAEDDVEQAQNDLKALNLNGNLDSLVGIAASGRTPYVLSCLSFAKSLGCTTIGIACCEPSAMSKEGNVDHMISVVTGPEVVTGSTRMKAGTATKMVLNMLSTGLMIKLGKTYGNMMIDLKATNQKLQQRSRNIIRTICSASNPTSDEDLDMLLQNCDGSVKLAIATIVLKISVGEAKERLGGAGGVLAKLLHDPYAKTSGKSLSNGLGGKEYVLSVDAGGSKCAAVLLGRNGEMGRGEAGECNVSSVGVESAMSSISLAIQRAVDSCPTTRGKQLQSIPFRKVWVGLAGYDRPNISIRVDSFLARQFSRLDGQQLEISSDIDLLVTAVGNQHHLNTIIVLVAGTGSVAMSYERDGNKFKRVGRNGGWGHLLGDDGSGYDIGRQGLRLALEATDKFNLRQHAKKQQEPFDLLVGKILEYFEIESKPVSRVDLLSRVLSPEASSKQQPSSKTRKIAEVARVVLDVISSSDAARNIAEAGSQSLVRILATLIEDGGVEPSSSSLILAGGLVQNETYQELFLNKLSSSGLNFGHIQAVSDPALTTAKYLLQEI